MKGRKLIDERGRIFGVISAIDILAVLAVAALAVMAYMRFFSGGEANVSDSDFVPVTYQIKVSEVRNGTVRAIHVDDRLWSEDGEDMGAVTAVDVSPAVKLVETTGGQVREMEVEGYYDVLITMSAQGSVNDGRYYAGRTFELGVNGRVQFTSKYVSTSGVIWSVG